MASEVSFEQDRDPLPPYPECPMKFWLLAVAMRSKVYRRDGAYGRAGTLKIWAQGSPLRRSI